MSSRGYVVVTTPGWPWMENIKCWHCVMVVTPDSRWIYIYEMLRSCDDNHLYLDSLCMGDMKCWGHMMMDILAYNEWRIWNVEIMWWWPPWLTMNGGDEMLRSCDDGHPSSQWMEEMKCWGHVIMTMRTLTHNDSIWSVEVIQLWLPVHWLTLKGGYEVLWLLCDGGRLHLDCCSERQTSDIGWWDETGHYIVNEGDLSTIMAQHSYNKTTLYCITIHYTSLYNLYNSKIRNQKYV